ncbi:MAG: hypothetical protein HY900_24420 [Deltaproteobacteria bacterium]|nr:hypothetical protein [Deltaproteobacteria bacterium]
MARALTLSILAAAACLLGTSATGSGVIDPLERPAGILRNPASAVFLDVARAGNRIVAAGERGMVALSDDGGKTWRQGRVPTSVSLTAVEFPSAKAGWAVGHGGVILHTGDGGETWTRQLDGKQAARMALEAAQAAAARAPNDEGAKARLVDAERLVADGADKPFLGIQFTSDRTGVVVGAYGLIFGTEDAGRTWRPWMDRLDNPKGLHLYAIRSVGQTVYLAGEQGLFLRSLDGGGHFQRLQTPYAGTYFTLAVTRSGAVVLAGLRGNAYRSDDRGKTFAKVAVPSPISLGASVALSDGRLLFSDQAGHLLESRDDGRTLQILPVPQLPPVAGLAELGAGNLLTAGVAGVIPVSLRTDGGAQKGGAR